MPEEVRFKYRPPCGSTEKHAPHPYYGNVHCPGLTQFEKDTLYPEGKW